MSDLFLNSKLLQMEETKFEGETDWIYLSLLECFCPDYSKCSTNRPEVNCGCETPSPGINFIIFAVFINNKFKAGGLIDFFW